MTFSITTPVIMTFNITTHSIMTLRKTTLVTMTFSLNTLSKMGLIATQHNVMLCVAFFIAMLSVVRLSVVTPKFSIGFTPITVLVLIMRTQVKNFNLQIYFVMFVDAI